MKAVSVCFLAMPLASTKPSKRPSVFTLFYHLAGMAADVIHWHVPTVAPPNVLSPDGSHMNIWCAEFQACDSTICDTHVLSAVHQNMWPQRMLEFHKTTCHDG